MIKHFAADYHRGPMRQTLSRASQICTVKLILMQGKRIVRLKFDSWMMLSKIDQAYWRHIPNAEEFCVRLDESRNLTLTQRMDPQICPVCATGPQEVHRYEAREAHTLGNPVLRLYRGCRSCGFWNYYDSTAISIDMAVPFMKSFDPSNEAPSLMSLASEIQKNPADVYSMDFTRFELLVGSVLKEFYDCEIYHVGKSVDGGVDLIMVEKDEPILIQVKRRTRSDIIEGIDVVKHLFASAFSRGARFGKVVTTAQSFSKPAQSWINLPTLRDIGFEMELIAFDSLLLMIGAIGSESDSEFWQDHLATKSGDKPIERAKSCDVSSHRDGWLVTLETSRFETYIFLSRMPGVCLYVGDENVIPGLSTFEGGLAQDALSFASINGYSQWCLDQDSLVDVFTLMPSSLIAQIIGEWERQNSEIWRESFA